VLGFIPMMFIAFAFRELASETPDCGAAFTWVTRAFGPLVGWAAGWTCLISAIVGIGNGAQIAAIYLLRGALSLIGAATMTWALVSRAIDMYSPSYGKTRIGPVGGVFAMGMGLLLLGVPVGALLAVRGRDYFRGRTLNSTTAVLVPE